MDSPETHIEELLFIKKNEKGEYTRRQVRSLIFHFLYAMDEHDYDVSLGSLIDSFNRGFDQEVVVDGEIAHTAQEIIAQRYELDARLEKYLENWRLDRLGLCTKLILRMGLWELLNSDVPGEVIINESVDLSKGFSEQDAYKFVNGVLDRIAIDLGKKTPEADKPNKKKRSEAADEQVSVDESDLESITEEPVPSTETYHATLDAESEPADESVQVVDAESEPADESIQVVGDEELKSE